MYGTDVRAPDLRTIDLQIRRLEAQVNHLDSHLGQMCILFSGYVRKTRDIGNKGDLLVREISLYADAQTPLSLQHCIKEFARQLSAVQDCRHASVDRLDSCVVAPLMSYGGAMRRNRDALKATQCAREKVARQEARLRLLHMAERKLEVTAAIVEVARSARLLKDTIEQVRVQEIKKIPCDFTEAEMSFHAQALELYTLAYRRLKGEGEEDDRELDTFRGILNAQRRTRPPRGRREASGQSEEEEDDDSGASDNCTGPYMMNARTWYPGREEEEDEEEEDEEEDGKRVGHKYKGIEGDIEDEE